MTTPDVVDSACMHESADKGNPTTVMRDESLLATDKGGVKRPADGQDTHNPVTIQPSAEHSLQIGQTVGSLNVDDAMSDEARRPPKKTKLDEQCMIPMVARAGLIPEGEIRAPPNPGCVPLEGAAEGVSKQDGVQVPYDQNHPGQQLVYQQGAGFPQGPYHQGQSADGYFPYMKRTFRGRTKLSSGFPGKKKCPSCGALSGARSFKCRSCRRSFYSEADLMPPNFHQMGYDQQQQQQPGFVPPASQQRALVSQKGAAAENSEAPTENNQTKQDGTATGPEDASKILANPSEPSQTKPSAPGRHPNEGYYYMPGPGGYPAQGFFRPGPGGPNEGFYFQPHPQDGQFFQQPPGANNEGGYYWPPGMTPGMANEQFYRQQGGQPPANQQQQGQPRPASTDAAKAGADGEQAPAEQVIGADGEAAPKAESTQKRDGAGAEGEAAQVQQQHPQGMQGMQGMHPMQMYGGMHPMQMHAMQHPHYRQHPQGNEQVFRAAGGQEAHGQGQEQQMQPGGGPRQVFGPMTVMPHHNWSNHTEQSLPGVPVKLIQYSCDYCGQIKMSTSIGRDGRVRIRCDCGGKYCDNVCRMHAMWHAVNPAELQGHPKMQYWEGDRPAAPGANGAPATGAPAATTAGVADQNPTQAAQTVEVPLAPSTEKKEAPVTAS